MRKSYLLALAAFGLSVTCANPASAAFEWHAPKKKVKRIKVETVPAAPVAPVEAAPEIKWNAQSDTQETVIDIDLPEPISEDAVYKPTPVDASAPEAIEVLKKPNANYSYKETAVKDNMDATPAYYGFGSDIPLVMAVGQIIPEGYSPVFSKHINLGQRISWKAADSWSQSLEKALKEVGLGHRVDGNTVYVLNQYEAKARVIDAIPQPKMVAPVTAQPKTTKDLEQVIELSNTADPVIPEVIEPKTDTSKKWLAGSNETLRDTLQRWSDQNDSQLYWLIDYDYRLKKPVSIDGRFEDAVKNLLDQFEGVKPRPYGQLFRSANNSHVLTIKAYGVE